MPHFERLVLVAGLFAGSQLTVWPTQAAAIHVLSAADLNPTDATTKYPGTPGSVFSSPLSVTAGANTVTFASPAGSFDRFAEGTGFNADFAPGTPLLVAQSSNYFDISFASGITEAGLQVQTGYVGFVGLETLTAYNGSAALGSWSIGASNNGTADGSAPFLGLRTTGGDLIMRLRISNQVSDVPEFDYYFGFGPLTFGTPPVPPAQEPSNMILVGIALLLLPAAARLQRLASRRG